MDFEEFSFSLQSPRPVYAIKGSDQFLKKQVYEACLGQVEPEVRAFNWSVFDLDTDSAADVIQAARTLPWLASRRFVYVRRADDQPEELGSYLRAPCMSTVLILEATRIPASWKGISIIESADVEPATWVLRRSRSAGYELEKEALEALIELCGDDRHRLQGELERLFLLHIDDRKITRESVVQTVFHSRELEIFTLTECVATGDCARALVVFNHLQDAGTSAPQVLSLLYAHFRRLLVVRELLNQGVTFAAAIKETNLWSYKDRERQVRGYRLDRLRGFLLKLAEADQLIKTTSTDPQIHLERLIIDSCAGGSL
ncbi:MAG: DNA polymerase III subunit delta [Acidobacteria bacterium]|nr:DNA polymerase III subunit delta [Acidobacteriota bacterium]